MQHHDICIDVEATLYRHHVSAGFTVADSNSFLSPKEIRLTAQEKSKSNLHSPKMFEPLEFECIRFNTVYVKSDGSLLTVERVWRVIWSFAIRMYGMFPLSSQPVICGSFFTRSEDSIPV